MFISQVKKKVNSALKIYKLAGLNGIKNHIRFLKYNIKSRKDYQKWIKKNILTQDNRNEISNEINNLKQQPLISILMPVYNVDEKWLKLCIESVINQIYQNWELCIADDCSPKPHIRKVLEEYLTQDSRIKVVFREKNGHISAASNSALELATGEFSVLLDHDDELSEDALFYVVKELNDFPQTAMIYSDEDMIDQRGNRFDPKFKPDWSPDLFLSLNMITHLSAYKTSILRKIGGFEIGAEGSQDYDLALRVTEEISEHQIRHIPRILYHWRAIPGSVAFAASEKSYAHERAREAIRRHLARKNVDAEVSNGVWELHRVIYPFPKDATFDVVSSEPDLASKLNLEAAKSKADVLIFVDSSIKFKSEESLLELASHALRNEIGAVGGRICNSDSTVRNNGILIGVNGLFGFSNRGLPKEFGGKFARNQVIQNFSAVSGVLAVRRELFEELGGFDEINFENGLFEIDFCLRLREKNYRIVFTPYAEFLQLKKSATENILPNSKEADFFKLKWAKVIEKDPYFNQNLDQKCEDYSVKL